MWPASYRLASERQSELLHLQPLAPCNAVPVHPFRLERLFLNCVSRLSAGFVLNSSGLVPTKAMDRQDEAEHTVRVHQNKRKVCASVTRANC